MAIQYVYTGYIRTKFKPYANALPFSEEYNLWINQMHIHSVSAKEWILDPWFKQGPRLSGDINLMYINDGEGEISLGFNQDQVFKVRTGDIVICPAQSYHSEFFSSPSQTRLTSLHFSASLFGQLDVIHLAGFPLMIPASHTATMSTYIKNMVREEQLGEIGWQRSLEADVIKLLVETLRQCGPHFKERPLSKSYQLLLQMKPAFEYLESHSSFSSISISDLAKQTKLSEPHFRQLFKKLTGFSPLHYMQRFRIQKSCLDLHHSKLSIASIAEKYDFKDLAHYYRIFKVWTKTTPSKYRSQTQLLH